MGQGYVGRVWGRVMWVGYRAGLCGSSMGQGYEGRVWGMVMRVGYGAGL